MKIALIVAADEPALFFASIRDAEQYLEPIDVQDGVYTAAYGPNGEPHRISTDGLRVTITELDDRSQPDALKALLLRYLAAMGETANDTDGLVSLLAQCEPGLSA